MIKINELPIIKSVVGTDSILVDTDAAGTGRMSFDDESKVVTAAIPNPNLLDNPDFKINQRGLTTYPDEGYAVDRWMIRNCNLNVMNTGIELVTHANKGGYFYIKLENSERFVGKTVTLSFLINIPHGLDGFIAWTNTQFQATSVSSFQDGEQLVSGSFEFPETLDNVGIYFNPKSESFSVKLYFVKLELGDHQTLAHQDSSGNWVLNEIPNYALELLKCQRYYIKMPIVGKYTIPSLPDYLVGDQFPVKMRTSPTVTVYSNKGTKNKVSDVTDGTDSSSSVRNVSAVEEGAFGFVVMDKALSTNTLYSYVIEADANL